MTTTAKSGEGDVLNWLTNLETLTSELRASETRFTHLIHNNPDGVLVLDQSGAILFANPAAAKMFGHASTALAGHVFGFPIVLGEACEIDLVTATGATVAEMRVAEIDWKGQVAYLAMLRDVTDRKRLEAALRDSEERLRLVMQNSPDVIAVWDDRGTIEYLSPALERMVGSVQAEVVRLEGMLPLAVAAGCGSEVATEQLAALGMDPLGVENWMKMRNAVCHCVNHPGEKIRVEYRQRIDSGEFRDLETVYQGFTRSTFGHEVVAITRDITEHKALQRLLHQANAELEERVAARTAELAATVTELHRANAGKDAFMAAISHELRTPLVGILGMGELLQTQARGPLNLDQERYVARIRESGERLLATVNSVLRYTSLIAEQTPIEREQCRLLELCASSVRTVQPQAERKRQTIALDVAPADLVIVASTDGIINIVTTLLDNAVKFTPEGGAIGVEVRCTAYADAVRLVVWDTGIGMTAEHVAVLFQPFSQADQGLTRQFAGIGIGLAYVSKMVEMLGGAVAVESVPGAGSRFMVTLPAVGSPIS